MRNRITKDVQASATKYINQVLQSNKQYGNSEDVPAHIKEQAIMDVAKTFATFKRLSRKNKRNVTAIH